MEVFKVHGSVYVDSGDAEKNIESTGKKAEGLAGKIGKTVKAAAGLGSALISAAAKGTKAMFGLATDAAGVTDEIDKMSQKIGMSKQAYQEFDYVAQLCGADVNVMQAGMKTLRKQTDKANSGTADSVELFNRLGVSLVDANGYMKDQETVMWEVFDALQGVEDETERATLATKLFGGAGAELMPMLNGETGSIAEMREEAHRLGLVLSDEDIAMGVQFTDTLTKLHDVLDILKTKVGIELIPIFENLGEFVLSKMPEIQTVTGAALDYISRIVSLAWDVISDIIWSIEDALGTVGEALSDNEISWDDVWNGITTIIKKCGEVISITIKAIGELIAWLVDESQEDGTYINTVWKNIQAAVEMCFKVIEPLLNMIIDILNGDWQSAFENGKKVVETVFDGIYQVINNNIEFVKGVLDSIVAFFTGSGEGTWSDAFEKGKKKVSEWIDSIKEWFQSVDWLGMAGDIATGVIDGLIDIMSSAWSNITTTVSGWVDNLWNSVKNTVSGWFGGGDSVDYTNPSTPQPYGGYSYHDKATDQPYLLDSATVFGRDTSGKKMVGGETHDEVIYGRENLMRDIAQASGNEDVARIMSGYFDQIITIMSTYFPQFLERKPIYLDTGVLVSELAPGIDRELGRSATWRY